MVEFFRNDDGSVKMKCLKGRPLKSNLRQEILSFDQLYYKI